MKNMDKKIAGVGLGLRHGHFKEFIEDKPDVPWLEIHTENFFSADCNSSKYLDKIRQDYPLSAHSVGLSLGSALLNCPVREKHLQQVKQTIDRLQPQLVSDHLSWSASDGVHYLPDLLPVPYTEEALEVMVQNIDHVQTVLKRQILIENPSSYLSYKDSPMQEWEFLNAVVQRSGCGLLLDINNIYVSAHNHGFNADQYVQEIPHGCVQEIHLAGYSIREIEGQEVYIDTHGHRVYEPVWELYAKALERFGEVPTLIEWDVDVPDLKVLMAEKFKAEDVISKTLKSRAA